MTLRLAMMHHDTKLGYKRLSDSEDTYRTGPTDKVIPVTPPAFNIVTGGITVLLLCCIHIHSSGAV